MTNNVHISDKCIEQSVIPQVDESKYFVAVYLVFCFLLFLYSVSFTSTQCMMECSTWVFHFEYFGYNSPSCTYNSTTNMADSQCYHVDQRPKHTGKSSDLFLNISIRPLSFMHDNQSLIMKTGVEQTVI